MLVTPDHALSAGRPRERTPAERSGRALSREDAEPGALRRTHGLPLSSYGVLIKLSHGGDRGRGMGELTEARS
jgi:hypothetical protein